MNFRPKYPVKSLEKGLSILELINRQGENLSVTEIGKHLGLKKGTVHRMLRTMAAKGFIHQEPKDKKYGLGIRAIELGAATPKNKIMKQIILPYLQDILERSGESVSACILEGEQLRTFVRLEPDKFLRVSFYEGCVLPAHCLAPGKLLLSSLKDEDLKKRYGKDGAFKKVTPNSIDSLDKLMKELKKIRAEKVAYDYNEVVLGGCSVAAPVYDGSGVMICAISLSAPKERVTKAKMATYTKMILDTSKKISTLF